MHQTPSGRALGRSRVASSVRYLGAVSVVQQGNDTGPGLGDITSANPANPLFPAILAGSKRRMVFGVRSVRVEGTPLGAHSVGGPPCPIVTCGDPTSLPTVGGALNLLHSVSARLTPEDYGTGWLAVFSHVLVDLLMQCLVPSQQTSEFASAWLRSEATRMTVGTLSATSLLKSAAKSVLVGLATAAVHREGPTFKLRLGGNAVSVTSESTFGESVEWSVTLRTTGRPRAHAEMTLDGVRLESGGPQSAEDALDALNDLLWSPWGEDAWL